VSRTPSVENGNNTGRAGTKDPCFTLYHCATLTHDKDAKIFTVKKAFCHSKMTNIYEIKVHIPANIKHTSKRVFCKL
jgi:hypothetical protein